MKIYVGHIDKRLNSTKQKWTDWDTPNGIEVRLKEPTDIKNPIFLISRKTTSYEYNPRHNYMSTPWGFYYIDDVTFDTNDIISIATHRDVLATGKDYITAMNAYVSYCSDTAIAKNRNLIDDPRLGPDIYAGSTEMALSTSPTGNTPLLVESWLVDSVSDGTVAVTLMGFSAGIITWFMSLYEYYSLCAAVSQEGPSVSTQDILVSKFMGLSWKESLISAVYMPISLEKINTYFTASDSTILWGSVEISMDRDIHYTVNNFTATGATHRRALRFIDLAEKSGYEFLKGSRYSKVFLETPSGSQDISSDAFIDYSQVVCQEMINFVTGEYTLKVYTSKGADTIGVPVGQVTENLGFALAAAVDTAAKDKTIVSGLAITAGKVTAAVAAGFMTAGTAAVAAGDSAGAARAAGFGLKDSIKYEMSGYSRMATQGTTTAMATGIIGAYEGGGAGSIGNACSNGGGITSYFSFSEDGRPNSRTNFRIITTTSVPALMYDEDIYPPSPAPPTPIGPQEYPKFAALHGYPCNKWAHLGDIKDGSYIQTVGASLGADINQNDDDPLAITWTLYPSELAELNNYLNTGIYYE